MNSLLSETPQKADILSSLPVDVTAVLAGLKTRSFSLKSLMASNFSPITRRVKNLELSMIFVQPVSKI